MFVYARIQNTYCGTYRYNAVFKDDGTGLLYEGDLPGNGVCDAFTSADVPADATAENWIFLNPDGSFQEYRILGRFTHTEDLNAWAQLDVDERDEVVNSTYWESCNEQLDDDRLIEGNLEDEPMVFTTGTEEEFERVIRAVILTDPDRDKLGDFAIASEINEHAFSESDLDNITERTTTLVADHVMRFFAFSGCTWEYCDSNDDQYSGYGPDPIWYNFDSTTIIAESSARERADAKLFLRAWLTERSIDPAPYFAPTDVAA